MRFDQAHDLKTSFESEYEHASAFIFPVSMFLSSLISYLQIVKKKGKKNILTMLYVNALHHLFAYLVTIRSITNFCCNLSCLIRARYIQVDCMDIHGKQKQQKRTSTFFEFCKAEKGILLCTDVAARGLDIPAVVSYDVYFSFVLLFFFCLHCC